MCYQPKSFYAWQNKDCVDGMSHQIFCTFTWQLTFVKKKIEDIKCWLETKLVSLRDVMV